MKKNLNLMEKQNLINKVEQIKKETISRRQSGFMGKLKNLILKGVTFATVLSILMSSASFAGEHKDKLQENLNNKVDELEDQVEADELLQKATEAVGKSELTITQEDVDIAKALVNKLSDGKDKDDLLDRLNTIEIEVKVPVEPTEPEIPIRPETPENDRHDEDDWDDWDDWYDDYYRPSRYRDRYRDRDDDRYESRRTRRDSEVEDFRRRYNSGVRFGGTRSFETSRQREEIGSTGAWKNIQYTEFTFANKEKPAITIVLGLQKERINLNPSSYIYENGKVFFPLRSMAQALGYEVGWSLDKGLSLKRNSEIIVTKIGSNLSYSGKGSAIVNTPPVLRNDVTYVSLDFMTEVMGLDFQYEVNNGVVEFYIK